MEALISGSAKLAALIYGDTVSVVNCKGDTVRSTKYAEVARQFDSYDDTISLVETDTENVLNVLRFESDRNDTLLLILSILDSEVTETTKAELASLANKLLENDSILDYVRGILYARPLPDNSIKVVPDSLNEKFPLVNNLIQELLGSQERIEHIYSFWIDTANKFRLNQDEVRRIEGTFACLGVGYNLCRSSISNAEYGTLEFGCLKQLRTVQNGRRIVTSLFKSFKNVVDEDHKVFWPVDHDEYEEKKLLTKTSSVKAHDLYEQVSSQINRISELLQSGDISHAEIFANELIDAQLERKDNAYAAMSLCSLSEEAKNIGNFSLQLNWAKRAVEIEPRDPRSYGHVAEAYLNLWQLENAREWFEECIRQGDKPFGKTGLARIERALFNYEHALELIEDAQADDQHSSAILNLKAELLRDLDRLEDAANLYAQLIVDFPENSIPMCGLAAVKTDQREFKEAESIYRDAIRLYPDKQVPLTGVGFLLAKQGRFNEAFKLLDKGIEKAEKGDVIPWMAKASALRMKGKHTEAVDVYVELNHRLPFYADSRFELIDTLGYCERYVDAENILNIAKVDFKDDERFVFSEALLYMYQSKFTDALTLLDYIKFKRPRWIKPLLARAKVLKQLGYFDQAKKQYEEVLGIRPLERHAIIGLEVIDAVTTPLADIKSDVISIPVEHEDHLNTIDDWVELNIRGLLLLSQNRAADAKDILSKGYKKTPFSSIKEDFAISLSVARTMLGQHGVAIKSIKNVRNDFGLIQQAIVYGEQGKLDKAEKSLSQVRPRTNLSNVISMVSRRYSKRAALIHDVPSSEQVISEQLRTLLLAA